MTSYIKALVSSNRRRLKTDSIDGTKKFDLDLTYIVKDRIIAMGWPGRGSETIYRNDINNLLIRILSNYYKLDYSDRRTYEKHEINNDDLKSFSGHYLKRKLFSPAKIQIINKENKTLRIKVFGNGIDEMEFGMNAISKNRFISEILGIEVVFDIENSNLIAILGDGEEHKFKKRKK